MLDTRQIYIDIISALKNRADLMDIVDGHIYQYMPPVPAAKLPYIRLTINAEPQLTAQSHEYEYRMRLQLYSAKPTIDELVRVEEIIEQALISKVGNNASTNALLNKYTIRLTNLIEQTQVNSSQKQERILQGLMDFNITK